MSDSEDVFAFSSSDDGNSGNESDEFILDEPTTKVSFPFFFKKNTSPNAFFLNNRNARQQLLLPKLPRKHLPRKHQQKKRHL